MGWVEYFFVILLGSNCIEACFFIIIYLIIKKTIIWKLIKKFKQNKTGVQSCLTPLIILLIIVIVIDALKL